MNRRALFRRAARLEYDEAASWYESQRLGLGVEFVFEIERALLQACETPLRFPRMLADVRCVRVRRFPYSIFFRVRSDHIIVLSVFHARREPAVWRERT
jgi:plasmid stabilization system protein ParE